MADCLLLAKKPADEINPLPSIEQVEQARPVPLSVVDMPPQVVGEIAARKESLISPPSPSERVEKLAPPMRVGFRYTTPDGIGYKQGYSTLEAFFSSIDVQKGRWLKFMDLRGHVFDNGKMAANAGLGLRRISSSRVWGINAYYDYRNTKHQHYNQVSAGLEMLGRVWDLRLNGYLPVGAKTSDLRHTHFDTFEGNYIILRSTKDFAMRGANFEMGRHIGRSLYVAGGPYYLNGKGATTWGGELRARLDLFNQYVRLEGNTSYDHLFRWVGQGQISINIPLGKSRKLKCSDATCARKKTLYERAMQRIDRHEIIPVGKYHPESVAIDPVTDLPYFVVFVDNTSSSLGTFESPYSSLAAAESNSGPNDIIYVFPGDGTPKNMDMGIRLQDRQMLLGASTVHPIATTLGGVSIPRFAAEMPAVTSAGPAVVTLANDNLVSGMLLGNFANSGISGTGINNFTATQNAIIGSDGIAGIFLSDVTGQVTIDNNVFSQTSASNGAVYIQQTTAQCAASFSNDTFYCFETHGIYTPLTGMGSITTLNVANTAFNGGSTTGDFRTININLADDSSIPDILVSNSNMNSFPGGIRLIHDSSQLVNQLSVVDTKINNSDAIPLQIYLSAAGSIDSVVISKSEIINNLSTTAIECFLTAAGSISSFEITDSNISHNGSTGTYLLASGTGSISNFYAANSHFDHNIGNGILIQNTLGSIQHVEINNCTLDNNVFYGLGLFGSVNASDFIISNSSASRNNGDGLNFLFTGSGGIENMEFVNCEINANDLNNLSISNQGLNISTLSLTNCNLDESNLNGVNVGVIGTGSLTNLAISHCSIEGNNERGINLFEAGAGWEKISLSHSSVSENADGLVISSSSGIPADLSVKNTVFKSNTRGVSIAAGVFNGIEISECTINDARTAGISFAGGVSQLQIKDSSFSGNLIGITLNPSDPITKGVIANNTFNGNGDRVVQIVVPSGGQSVLALRNNVFGNTSAQTDGYEVVMDNTSGGTLCLDFFQNATWPINWGPGFDPYLLDGPIDLTSESTQANNTGTINTATATLGSCTQ